MVKMYCRQGEIFRSNHQGSKNNQLFANVYEWLTFTLFADNMEDFRMKFGANMFDNGTDCKKFLEDYFGIETLGDLTKLHKTDWLKMRNSGKKSLGELDDLLTAHGLEWAKYE